mmetsp:Transcript_135941/g.352467  ORF Transcript_135941/g.352467 Transcript_135941/m.352467 type:complete len:302 (-) Transcript_135941:9-914(-)
MLTKPAGAANGWVEPGAGTAWLSRARVVAEGSSKASNASKSKASSAPPCGKAFAGVGKLRTALPSRPQSESPSLLSSSKSNSGSPPRAGERVDEVHTPEVSPRPWTLDCSIVSSSVSRTSKSNMALPEVCRLEFGLGEGAISGRDCVVFMPPPGMLPRRTGVAGHITFTSDSAAKLGVPHVVERLKVAGFPRSFDFSGCGDAKEVYISKLLSEPKEPLELRRRLPLDCMAPGDSAGLERLVGDKSSNGSNASNVSKGSGGGVVRRDHKGATHVSMSPSVAFNTMGWNTQSGKCGTKGSASV